MTFFLLKNLSITVGFEWLYIRLLLKPYCAQNGQNLKRKELKKALKCSKCLLKSLPYST